MRPIWVYVVWLAVLCLGDVQAQPFNGQVRLQWDDSLSHPSGVIATANNFQAGTVAAPVRQVGLEAELRASGRGLTSVLTLRQSDTAPHSRAWVNELYASHDAGAWQLGAGKKIVAWDVGYAFRPNDTVQQEDRRTLVNSTATGRPLLQAEYFDTDAAWSMVWVNPTATVDALGAEEPALVGRMYRRRGAVDWYGFARMGDHTGHSLGAAVAWVAGDALELHGSMRRSERVDRLTMMQNTGDLLTGSPWQASTERDVTQWLVGGTWTHSSQLGLLAELWWDGSALSDAQWDDWSQRNRRLMALAGQGAPLAAVAGNLAWQAQALGASANLRRSNVYVRLSWQHEAWQPAVDVLYTPADQGRVVTGSLTWQGDRVTVQSGVRVFSGPAEAIMAQLPAQRQGFVALRWAF